MLLRSAIVQAEPHDLSFAPLAPVYMQRDGFPTGQEW